MCSYTGPYSMHRIENRIKNFKPKKAYELNYEQILTQASEQGQKIKRKPPFYLPRKTITLFT